MTALVLTVAILASSVPSHREGVISHMGPGYGADYLALPCKTPANTHCRLTVELCGPARCRVMTQSDYGPSQRIHPDRIADVSEATFEYLCGCDSSRGVMRGSWRVVDPAPRLTLPPTDTASGTPPFLLSRHV